jgi:D-alanine--poly(phosphoribitol) ligase subunit 1
MSFNEILRRISLQLVNHHDNNAFFIKGEYSKYDDLAQQISNIRNAVKGLPDSNLALVGNDDVETYASIIALWLEGKCYVPLHPLQPIERCRDIIRQVGINFVLDSSEQSEYCEYHVIHTKHLENADMHIGADREFDDGRLAYILFTSGSTGRPKGVKISRGNLAAFIEAFERFGYPLGTEDRCLQMFDLTFDLSVMSYLLPMLYGACIYTVSPERIKYQAAFELMDEEHITFAMMVPSVLHYLRPYMDEIDVPSMRYSMFAGEALPLDDVAAWSKCVPHAVISNTYGPTECTIICTGVEYNRQGDNLSTNGTMSIGKAMYGTEILVIDDNNRMLPDGEIGELCLASPQLSTGYWHDAAKDKEAFFAYNGKRYYKTGDVCMVDDSGEILYYGRKDSQIKIQGFRIELSEIECIARQFYGGKRAAVAIPVSDSGNNYSIHLVIEDDGTEDTEAIIVYMKKYLPSYMIPSRVHFMKQFPLNTNNKIDRKHIKTIIYNQ